MDDDFDLIKVTHSLSLFLSFPRSCSPSLLIPLKLAPHQKHYAVQVEVPPVSHSEAHKLISLRTSIDLVVHREVVAWRWAV